MSHKFSSTLGLLIWSVHNSLYESSLCARLCVCDVCVCERVCLQLQVCVCVSALCEKWCENASRGACVSSASNMRKICGTYLQYDTSQNDMTQPCYIWLIQPQPAERLLAQQSSKKTGRRLKKCAVTLLKWSVRIWSKHLNVIFAVKLVSAFLPLFKPIVIARGQLSHTSNPPPPLAILEWTWFFFFSYERKKGLHWLALCEQSIFTNPLDPSSFSRASQESNSQDDCLFL